MAMYKSLGLLRQNQSDVFDAFRIARSPMLCARAAMSFARPRALETCFERFFGQHGWGWFV
ncbi:MAG TPA: hypothetical protein VFG03_15415, partial [Telluria sp.]|nr:hypothetical protein [Telluria sp.]